MDQSSVLLMQVTISNQRKRIEDLESGNNWIDVETEVPENKTGKWSDDVIALTKEGNVYRLAIQDGYWQRTRAFVEDGNTEVTHWMPLVYPALKTGATSR